MKNNTTGVWSDEDYKLFRGKWRSKGEYDTVKEVRDRFLTMSDYRRRSCPLASPDTDTTSGNDWASLWNRSDRQKWMYHEYLDDRSNLKSPISFAPIQAANAEFANSDITFRFNYLQEKDKVGVMLHNQADIDWEKRVNNQQYKNDTFDEAITRGTSIPFVGWVNKTTVKEKLVVGQKLKKEIEKWKKEKAEEREAMMDSVMKEMRPMTKKETIVEYDDIAYIPTDLFEIYVDEAARELQGIANPAMDIIWRQLVPVETLKAEYRNSTDPYVIKKNIDRIVPAEESEAAYGTETPFFRKPSDITNSRMVELIRYWNRITNKYVVIANDVLLRDAIMPFNHGQLPFVRHRYLIWKDHFYGLGLPAILEGLQSEDEFLTNQMLDQLKINLNPPMTIDPEYFDDVDQSYETSRAGQKLSAPPGSIQWMPQTPSNYDYHTARKYLREDAVVSSGVNPSMYSLPRQGEAVRNNMMGMESTLKIIKLGIQRWSQGYWDAKRMMVDLRKQMFPISKLEEIGDDGRVNLKPRQIVMDDQKLEIERMGEKIIDSKVLKDSKRNIVELDDELMEFFETANVDIRLDLDEILPMSNSMKMQSIREALPIILQAFSQPQLSSNPAVMQVIKELIKGLPMDKKVLEYFPDETTEASLEKAEEQNRMMLDGEDVEGIPGEDPQHVYSHYRIAMALSAQISKISLEQQGVEQEASTIETPEEMLSFIEQFDAQKQGIEALQERLSIISKHIQLDETPREVASQGASGIIQANMQEGLPPEATGGVDTASPEMDAGSMPAAEGGMPQDMPIEDIQQL